MDDGNDRDAMMNDENLLSLIYEMNDDLHVPRQSEQASENPEEVCVKHEAKKSLMEQFDANDSDDTSASISVGSRSVGDDSERHSSRMPVGTSASGHSSTSQEVHDEQPLLAPIAKVSELREELLPGLKPPEEVKTQLVRQQFAREVTPPPGMPPRCLPDHGDTNDSWEVLPECLGGMPSTCLPDDGDTNDSWEDSTKCLRDDSDDEDDDALSTSGQMAGSIACPACGTVARQGARFCDQCCTLLVAISL